MIHRLSADCVFDKVFKEDRVPTVKGIKHEINHYDIIVVHEIEALNITSDAY